MFYKMLNFLRTCVRYFLYSEDDAKMLDASLSGKMENAISLWASLYSGNHFKAAKLPDLGIATAVCSEFARLATIEAHIKINGPRSNFINDALLPIITNLRSYTEYACALGGGVFKPYVAGGKIYIDFVQADCFIPTAFDNSQRMTGAVFCDQMSVGNLVYTRLEHHNLAGNTYTIENKAFCSKDGTSLGNPIKLSDVTAWAGIAPHTEIKNVSYPLFAYLRIPGANNIDRHSPLGVSVFGRACELILNANEQYSRLLWEFEGGELAIDAAQDVLMGLNDDAPRLPKGKQRLFRSLASTDSDFYNVYAPTLRDKSLENGLDIILKRIEFNCSLAYGTLSNPQNTDKTAEEIKASKQRSYAAVKDLQNALQTCITQLCEIVNTYADLYKLTPKGKYNIAFKWDDSIINDESYEREQMRSDCQSGAAHWYEYRMRFYGEDEQTAKAHVPSFESAGANKLKHSSTA